MRTPTSLHGRREELPGLGTPPPPHPPPSRLTKRPLSPVRSSDPRPSGLIDSATRRLFSRGVTAFVTAVADGDLA